ncbi:omptin family outer membrane protease [Afifella sp. H1R]|uniref:omptin family outer membrane protease n=1 Tax=Afifella sp. H1R TaxID=2908841 RepID=UPI001F33ECAC|nr:omptin family outer membrane protease [Afifella sp. H1R]MCF1505196.1 omptin family outer membrane protease [Afifella sp. H1R]
MRFGRTTTTSVACALGLGLAAFHGTALAADFGVSGKPGALDRSYSATLGTRYWYATGKTEKTLYDSTGDIRLSRLTYDDLDTHAGEVFGDITNDGIFAKGNAGLGWSLRGSLQDEDFPPALPDYSSTKSDQDDGHVYYVTIDGGKYLVERPNMRLGVFAGYNWLRQQVHAYGCQQEAAFEICLPGDVPDGAKVISQENDWHSARIGLKADALIGDRILVSAEGAILPYVYFDGADTHHLRPDLAGSVPETGTGWGYQLEGMVNYRLTDSFTIGLGGRYWHMETDGNSHFENVAAGGTAQDEDWSVDMFGVTAQAAVTF